MPKYALYPNRLSDRLLFINKAKVKGTPYIADFPNMNGDYFFSFAEASPHNPVLCTENSRQVKLTLLDTVKDVEYVIVGRPFKNGEVPDKPIYF